MSPTSQNAKSYRSTSSTADRQRAEDISTLFTLLIVQEVSQTLRKSGYEISEGEESLLGALTMARFDQPTTIDFHLVVGPIESFWPDRYLLPCAYLSFAIRVCLRLLATPPAEMVNLLQRPKTRFFRREKSTRLDRAPPTKQEQAEESDVHLASLINMIGALLVRRDARFRIDAKAKGILMSALRLVVPGTCGPKAEAVLRSVMSHPDVKELMKTH